MSISIYIAPINDGVELAILLLQEEFGLSEANSQYLAAEKIKPHFDKLKKSCYLVAETLYVDKVYRDSYYHYYSSKLNGQKRNCIRLSIFDGEVKEDEFRKQDSIKTLQDKFRGFIILRPTEPNIIGRSVISPQALRSNTFLCCTTKIQSTVNAVKLEVEGFPHSSQDTETITCAETTLWAVMEYFSSKYPDYKPVLPSHIVGVLNKITSERQVPSKGLDIQQMSFALKEFGFGTRIYSEEYEKDFNKMLSCYVESGIPLILSIGDWHKDDGDIGHAMLCIGHEKVNDEQINAIPKNNFSDEKLRKFADKQKLSIYDWDDVIKEFVFIDDNNPVYQKALLSEPTKHYDKSWHNCKIHHFIAPLYTKIYLEAFEAKNFALRFLLKGPKPLKKNRELLIRFYLASSRSYKDKLALNSSFDSDVRDMILEIPMPKFIWIAELSTKALIKQNKAEGIMILDATEANTFFNKPLIFALYEGNRIMFDLASRRLQINDVPLPPFFVYNNLRNL
jgi:hypothetical protein